MIGLKLRQWAGTGASDTFANEAKRNFCKIGELFNINRIRNKGLGGLELPWTYCSSATADKIIHKKNQTKKRCQEKHF